MSILRNLLRAGIFTAIFAVGATAAHAATLSLTGANGTVGNTLTVSVLVSAENGEPINAVSARVNYPSDKLQLVPISKAGSIITFWAEEPSFSNAAGTASLEGIVPNPGYSGTGGRVLTFVFQVQAPGSALLSFGNASVLANDGKGTNVLTSASSRTVQLSEAPTQASVPAPAKPSAASPKPAARPAVTEEDTAPETSTATSSDASSSPPVGVGTMTPRPQTSSDLWNIPVFILAILGLLALAGAGFYGFPILLHKLQGSRKRRDLVGDSFKLLIQDLQREIKRARRHPDPLAEHEAAFLTQFESDLKEVQKLVQRRITVKGRKED